MGDDDMNVEYIFLAYPYMHCKFSFEDGTLVAMHYESDKTLHKGMTNSRST